MRSLFALLCSVLAASAFAADRPVKTIATLPRPPMLTGDLHELKGGTFLKKVNGPTAAFQTVLGTSHETLYVGIDISDDQLTSGDVLELALHFPDAGATARGYSFKLALDGRRSTDASEAPEFAQKRVKSIALKNRTGITIEVAIPIRAFPRFPAKEPMNVELCLTYEDHDAEAGAGDRISNCTSGSMQGEALRLSPDWRRACLAAEKVKPPPEVVALEPREPGWVGYAILHYPIWAQGDAALTPASLAKLVSDEPVDPASAKIPLSSEMLLPKGLKIWAVLSGKDPYALEGKCDSDHELRLGLYLVNGRLATRALEWPAATCALGRASSIAVDDDDGALAIGYSNGSIANFTWAGNHFERTEIGSR